MKQEIFKVGDEVECINVDAYVSLTKNKAYTIVNWLYPQIRIYNDINNLCVYPIALFKLAEPKFTPETFSALNEKEAEKHIGKTMEFADASCVKINKWKKSVFTGFYTEDSIWSFKSNCTYWSFMRTCPETFEKKKVKKTVECWVNIYIIENKVHWTKPEAERCATPDRIACVKLTGDYEVEE